MTSGMMRTRDSVSLILVEDREGLRDFLFKALNIQEKRHIEQKRNNLDKLDTAEMNQRTRKYEPTV